MKKIMNAAIGLMIFGLLVIPKPVLAQEGKSDSLPTLEKVLEQYVEALGGRESIEKFKTRVIKGILIDNLSYKEPPVETTMIEIYAKLGNRCLVVSHDSKGFVRNGFDGEVSWKQKIDGSVIKDDFGKNKLAWLVNPHNALLLSDYFPGMKVTDKKVLGEQLAYVVDSERDRLYFSLYFDTETGLLIKIGHYWYLEDYREIDGIKFPFRLVRGRKGGTSTYVFDQVKHNTQIADSLFAMPNHPKH